MTALRIIGLILVLVGVAVACAGVVLLETVQSARWDDATVLVVAFLTTAGLVVLGSVLWILGAVVPRSARSEGAATPPPGDAVRRQRRRLAIRLGLVLVGVAVLGTLGGRWWGQVQPDPSRVTEALWAAHDGDMSAFRSCFDRPPADADAGGFAKAVRSRYGRLRDAQQVTGWTGPGVGHIQSARFRLTFDNAALPADVTIRPLVDEASSTGDLSYLGQVRIVRIVIRDSVAGNLTFP